MAEHEQGPSTSNHPQWHIDLWLRQEKSMTVQRAEVNRVEWTLPTELKPDEPARPIIRLRERPDGMEWPDPNRWKGIWCFFWIGASELHMWSRPIVGPDTLAVRICLNDEQVAWLQGIDWTGQLEVDFLHAGRIWGTDWPGWDK